MPKRQNEHASFWVQLRLAEKNIIEYTLQYVSSIRQAALSLGISSTYLSERVHILGVKLPPGMALAAEARAKTRAAKAVPPPKKQRGRPVGSKNKPKTATATAKAAAKPKAALALVPTPTPATVEPCDRPPPGWSCARPRGHDGPCPAVPHAELDDGDDSLDLDLDDDEEEPDAGPTVN